MKPRARALERPERLERSRLDADELERSLDDLAIINRWLGGYRALRLHLDDLPPGNQEVRILDVGAGDGATLLHLQRRAGPEWRFVGVEIHPQMVELARERVGNAEQVGLVRANGLRLPFPDRTFDATVCTLTLHHFAEDEAVELVREMARVSSRRIVVNDLERSLPHYLGALLLSRTLWRSSPITRHDAPLSVRRSFTPDELRRIGRDAGLARPRVRRHPVFRLVLEGVPEATDAPEDDRRGE